MKLLTNYALRSGLAKQVKIVNHHNSFLNGKVGTLVGRDFFGFYNRRVWLNNEHIAVIVHQANLVPANEHAVTFADVFAIQWQIFWHNVAIKVHEWLRR